MSNKIEILVMSRTEAQRTSKILMSPTAIISITDPEQKPANIFHNANIVGLLRLQFHDEEVNQNGFVAMNANDARDVAYFYNSVKKKASFLIVHCEAGISRSAGVAAAIAKYQDGDDSFFFRNYIPNMNCYNKTLYALHEYDWTHPNEH